MRKVLAKMMANCGKRQHSGCRVLGRTCWVDGQARRQNFMISPIFFAHRSGKELTSGVS